jgi:hypothetical protein
VPALKTGNDQERVNTDLASLIALARAQGAGEKALPVEKWNPEYCGEMDMVIRRDGSWWHEGTRITRAPLIKLFSSILRKDKDGHHYLVTPVEKIRIEVETAAFQAIRVDVEGEGESQRLFFTINMDEVVEAGPERPLRVITDPDTLEPTPLISVRGRLEAMLVRPVFYELVEHAVEIDTPDGIQLGVYGGGEFFPLGPAGVHEV